MSDDFEDSPGVDDVPDDCPGPDLSNIKLARQALAAACRLIKAGKMPQSRAGNYVNALTALVKSYQDARDSVWTRRSAVLWNERSKQKENAPEPEANH